jgi:hypothetical protein
VLQHERIDLAQARIDERRQRRLVFVRSQCPLHNFFSPPELPRSRANAHAPQQGEVECRINAPVVVAAGRGYAAVPL